MDYPGEENQGLLEPEVEQVMVFWIYKMLAIASSFELSVDHLYLLTLNRQRTAQMEYQQQLHPRSVSPTWVE